MTFTEFCKELLQEHGYSNFEYDYVTSFGQTFSDTTCGLRGIGGQALTNAQVFVFYNYNSDAIVIGPVWSYYIENVTDIFSVDVYNHNMAGISNIARLKRYGNIREIKRA